MARNPVMSSLKITRTFVKNVKWTKLVQHRVANLPGSSKATRSLRIAESGPHNVLLHGS